MNTSCQGEGLRLPVSRGDARRHAAAWLSSLASVFLLLLALPAQAQEATCARVKIEIKQQLTLERQAFDAQMKISNTTVADTIQNVGITVKVTDELGEPVQITTDPDNLSAKFYIRVSGHQSIADITGNGSVGPKSWPRYESISK